MTWCLYADPVNTPDLTELARRVRAASRSVARAPGPVRDDALRMAADLLEQESASVLEANRGDLARAESSGMAASAQDRLRLSGERVRAMAAGLRGVAFEAGGTVEIRELPRTD